ncbi:MAG: prolyl oligopeptidase family serine peptidase [Anaeroplasmataceae bacterium]|nr:prolyl oligopeptidase family serine peptidase [Anaeroplasmataceae bacterium]
MKKIIIGIIVVCVSIISSFTLFSCHSKDNTNVGGSNAGQMGNEGNMIDSSVVTMGTETYRGFLVDNVYHSKNNGDIHFHIYVPKSYDGNKPYALYVSLCGYGGYYFQGVGINLRQENFVFEAQKYNLEMIIVAPQLNDWGNISANQTIALTEYLISAYNIEKSKVYMNGYSGGGETLSLVMAKKPELFSAVLHVSSIWNGEVQPLANNKVPVYFVIGERDEYYGSTRISRTYETLCGLYRAQGLSDEQINNLAVLDVKPQSYFTERGAKSQHGGGGLFAFDENIMDWLFNR